VGGDMFYEYLGNDQYRLVLNVYRDCLTGGSGFDNTAHVGVYNGSSLVTTLEMPLSNATVTELPAGTEDPCLIPPAVCVEEAIYDEVFEIPYEPGMLTLVWQRCCRNTTLVNCDSNDDLGITITTQIPDRNVWGDNSSPDFINFPPIIICHSEAFVFDHSAFDPDGDSLVYTFCNPLLGPFQFGEIANPTAPPYNDLVFLPGYSFDYPLDSDPAFGIDFETGLLTGTPNQLGQFVVGICVEEYRNGELMTSSNRDFQFNIAFCSNEFNAVIANEPPCQGLDIEFGNDSNGDMWSWDFGDESLESDTSNVFEPEYSFPDSGAYTVTLIVNPGFDCADTTTMEILAYEPIVAEFEQVAELCIDGDVAYDFQGLGNYTSDAIFQWEFPDGSPNMADVLDPDPVIWSTAGEYEIVLSIEDHQCLAEYSQLIEVLAGPSAIFEGPIDYCEGLTADFINNSTNADEFYWDFGDDGAANDTSTDIQPSYTYQDSGFYTVMMIANPNFVCPDTTFIDLYVYEPFDASAEIVNDWCDLAISFYDFAPEGNYTSAATYSWEFENGSPSESTDENPDPVWWDSPGSYDITLTINDHFCEDDTTFSIDVFPPPVAIIQEQSVFCNGLTVDFGNLSINASNFVWDFGEPGIEDISLEEEPTHTYADYGTYQILLVADPETDCEDIDTVQFVLNPPDPIDFDFAVSAPDICDTTNAVIGSFNGIGADNVWWDMGDGTILDGAQVQYFYDAPGNYTITCYAEHEFCDYEENQSIGVQFGIQPIDRPVLVPNVFSPNNDGHNDRFRLFYAGESTIPNLYPEGFNIYDMMENYSIKIYDRWGILMHDSADDGGIWDGTYKNDDVADGTYFYIITWQRSCLDSSATTKTGEVEVLRK